MFLTITANSALDRVFFIDEFVPGGIMRTRKVVDAVGGKGFDTSVVFRALGQATLALGFIAGTTGKALVALLEEYGIQHELLWVDGDTRTAHVICEMNSNRHSHLMAGGYSVPAEAYRRFLEIYKHKVAKARWVVGAGSLPPGISADFYRTVVDIANRCGTPSLVDCPGLPALEASSARPTVLKMNQREFGKTFNVTAKPLNELVKSAQAIRQERALPALVITCGEEGLLAITPDATYHAVAPQQVAVNAAGAGDAASASLAWRLSLGDSWPQALCWAAATSAATVLTERTADCNRALIDRIFPAVVVHRIGLS
jgi:1-phosphofructokinase family hexose kinase